METTMSPSRKSLNWRNARNVFLALMLAVAVVWSSTDADANDSCETPTPIVSIPFSETRDVTAASTLTSEPVHSCTGSRGTNSVWYSFTATASGVVTAFTSGSNYDTVLAVYTGSCGSLTEVACNDDSGGLAAAQVTMAVSAETTYLLQVTGFQAASEQTLQLGLRSVRPADNDECREATAIEATRFIDTADASSATISPSDPSQSCSFEGPAQNAKSVWYRFTPPSDGAVVASTFASSYDTVLTAYRGSCGALVEVDCSDDVGDRVLHSEIRFAVTGGLTYLFEVTEFEPAETTILHFDLAFTRHPPSGRGVQLTPDGKRVLVNKDVGAERWAISLNEDGTATGNVFRADGGNPAFIFCAPRAEPHAYTCSGADPCSAGGTQRGIQGTPDGKRVLVNKDVGAERWAISLNDDGTATGNVFRADGGEPAFIFCTPRGALNAFSCWGAEACVTESCVDQYVFIADVTLPSGFFERPVPCAEPYSFIADVVLPESFFEP